MARFDYTILVILIDIVFSFLSNKRYSLFQAQSPISSASSNESWSLFRGHENLLLTSQQCQQIFPLLFLDLETKIALQKHQAFRRHITPQDIDAIAPKKGYVRVRLHSNSVFILAHQKSDFSRDYATLQALHRAVITAVYPLPDTEFILMTDDFPTPGTPSWAYTRRVNDFEPWLMPDYGFWAWPEPKVGEYAKVQRAVRRIDGSSSSPSEEEFEGELPWAAKDERLFWRGKAMVPIRETFLNETKGKFWADVDTLNWTDAHELKRQYRSMPDHCRHKFLAHIEGKTYSGRLKYLLNCRSVVFVHELEWIEHFHGLLVFEGPSQNAVLVRRDFSDLEEKVTELRRNDERARQIANNAFRTFSTRYLTSTAEVCYWRELIRTWDVIFNQSDLQARWEYEQGVPLEDFLLMRKLNWDTY